MKKTFVIADEGIINKPRAELPESKICLGCEKEFLSYEPYEQFCDICRVKMMIFEMQVLGFGR